MKHAFPLLILLLALFVGLPGLAQVPVRDSIPFESLKGQLPMPVDRFTNLNTYEQWLSQYKERHPMGYGGDTKSLTIQSDSPMIVKNQAAGKVLAVFEVDGYCAVMIDHGSHCFMYSNLDSAFVKKNDAIAPGQPIGKIFTLLSKRHLLVT